MVQTLYILALMTSLTFIFLSHPLSLGFNLLIQAVLIAMITGTLTYNYWFSYVLFMIMIGGLLVLFIYMTSVASNEKFTYSNSLLMVIAIMMTLALLFSFMDSFIPNIQSMNSDSMVMNSDSAFETSLVKYINYPSNMIMITMIIYLLIALIAVVKITNVNYGPLRQSF